MKTPEYFNQNIIDSYDSQETKRDFEQRITQNEGDTVNKAIAYERAKTRTARNRRKNLKKLAKRQNDQ